MSVPGLLPGGGVPLPLSPYGLPPLDPKHKAAILYFYYMTAGVAVARSTKEDVQHALQSCSHFAISVFMEKAYGVKIHPDAVQSYYREVRGSVEMAGIPWNAHAVAHIISRQVTDEDTFHEITSLMTEVTVSPKAPFLYLPSITADTRATTHSPSPGVNDFSWTKHTKPSAAKTATSCCTATGRELRNRTLAIRPNTRIQNCSSLTALIRKLQSVMVTYRSSSMTSLRQIVKAAQIQSVPTSKIEPTQHHIPELVAANLGSCDRRILRGNAIIFTLLDCCTRLTKDEPCD